MKSTKPSFLYKLYCIISMLFLLYVSGNAFVMREYSTSVILFCCFEVIALIAFSIKGVKIRYECIFFLSVVMFLMLMSLLTNTFEDVNSYIAIVLQLICAIIICSIVHPMYFEDVFCEIILALALVSLAFWLIAFVIPSFPYRFPVIISENLNLKYYNAYIHVYWEETGWGSQSVLSHRNAGIFWEPGVFQAFLNLGLFFSLRKEKKDILRVIILFVTILTTESATGYILAAVIFLFSFGKKIKPVYKIGILLGLSLLAYLAMASGAVSSRLTDEYLISRISFDKLPVILANFKSYLFGNTFYYRSQLTSTVWNSILDSCLVFGIPFVAVFLSRYAKYTKRCYNSRMLFFVLVMIFSVESLFWRPFFLCMIFYSFMTDSDYRNVLQTPTY